MKALKAGLFLPVLLPLPLVFSTPTLPCNQTPHLLKRDHINSSTDAITFVSGGPAKSANAINILPFIALPHGSSCTTSPYAGSKCSGVFKASAVPIADQVAIENGVTSVFSLIQPIQKSDPDCYNALAAALCTLSFPNCGSDSTVHQLCQSTCENIISICRNFFIKSKLLDVLETQLGHCTSIPTTTSSIPFPNSSCIKPHFDQLNLGNMTRNITANSTICTSFFVSASDLDDAVGTHGCASNGCCVPCPREAYFYPPRQFDIFRVVVSTIALVSSLLSCFVLISWLLLPGRRDHPGDIVIHFCIAVTMIQFSLFLTSIPSLGGKIVCANDSTVATARNNIWCGMTGAWNIFFTHASVTLAGLMITNIHATIVWKSKFIQRNKRILFLLCWGLPAIFTIIPLMESEVDATTSLYCTVDPTRANVLFFSFQGLFIIPSSIFNFCTIMVVARNGWRYLCDDSNATRVATSTTANLSAESISREIPLDSYNKTRIINSSRSGTHVMSVADKWTSLPPKSSHTVTSPPGAFRKILILLSMNWRTLSLGSGMLGAFIVYFIFFNTNVIQIFSLTDSDEWINDWTLCILNPKLGPDPAVAQRICSREFSEYIPSLVFQAIAHLLPSSCGFMIFIVFGCSSDVLYEWKRLIRGN